mmetsp:Transcript_27905/g.86929  ORF Transcript_27905/g.86929 Transcript_27905/m.86929 type:complete len:220 (-) Transcript_27905:400-1059(-)
MRSRSLSSAGRSRSSGCSTAGSTGCWPTAAMPPTCPSTPRSCGSTSTSTSSRSLASSSWRGPCGWASTTCASTRPTRSPSTSPPPGGTWRPWPRPSRTSSSSRTAWAGSAAWPRASAASWAAWSGSRRCWRRRSRPRGGVPTRPSFGGARTCGWSTSPSTSPTAPCSSRTSAFPWTEGSASSSQGTMVAASPASSASSGGSGPWWRAPSPCRRSGTSTS